jgi:hypothetical protein
MKIGKQPRRYFSECGFGKGTPLQAAEKSVSQSISGGAALQRCDNRFVLNGGFSR